MSWRDALKTLQKQFEARAERSGGLHHLFVEADDNERERLAGPTWFATKRPGAPAEATFGDPWFVVQISFLPGVEPWYRLLQSDENVDTLPPQDVVRDRSGKAWATAERMRLRQSYLCGDPTEVAPFLTMATAASNIITGIPDLAEHAFAEDLVDLFRRPCGVRRYIFGEVVDPPSHPISRGWSGGGLLYPHGVLVDVPISESAPGYGHWLLLLHRLSWRRLSGSPLQGQRLAWHEHTSMPFDWVVEKQFVDGLPMGLQERLAQISRTSYYSIIGTKDHPLDVYLASAFALQLLVSAESPKKSKVATTSAPVDYSGQDWHKRALPAIQIATLDEARTMEPQVIVLTATLVERDTVLKYMQPQRVLQVFHENNTYFVGTLGQYPVVLCMCEMGSSGRDAAQAVAAELIAVWKPTAMIMVGIAFGRDSERQKIGDVLVSERVISYEPARIGEKKTIQRGPEPAATPMLLNRFRNVMGWSFPNPAGIACDVHFGPILSGEKLVDKAEFKESLFDAFPAAIGGEMEGVGFAAAAERARCEWIVAKGICDWGDGTKDKIHQAFAASSAVSLVTHILNQANVVTPRTSPGALCDATPGVHPATISAVLRLREDSATAPTNAGPTHWFRLWIYNDCDAASSHSVEVIAYRAFKVMDVGLERLQGFVQSHLVWTYDIDRHKSAQIHSSMGQLCDIGYIPRATPGHRNIAPARPGAVGNEIRPFVLHTRIDPSSRFNELLPGKYKIELVIRADGFQPQFYALDVEWTGQWLDEIQSMIDKHIKITLSPGPIDA